MGKFIEKKLTDADFAGKNIQSIEGNTVIGQAAALKARFDSPAQVVMKEAFNALMDILESEDAAGSIGAPALSGTSGTTVGEQLKYLKELVAEAVLGQIADGSITDAKLSDAAAQIKARVSALEEDESKAPLDSPTFTGTPTAPTPGSGDNSTKLATTAFVAAALTLINTHLDNANVHVTAALKQAWNAHAVNTENPHEVTAAQVGAYPIYKSLADIGCTTANTLKEVYTALPQGTVLILDWCGKSVSAYSGTTFGNALPANYGPLYLYKPGGTNGVGKFEFWAYSSSETSIPYVKFVTNANGNWSETEWLMDTPLRSGDSVTMGSGFTNNGMELYKLGSLIVFTMRGKWTGSTTDINGRTICTLPAGYRPYGDTDSGIFRVTSAGECKCVQTASVAANATFSTCFIFYAHS